MPESRPPLNVGIELEWPRPQNDADGATYIRPAQKSDRLYNRIADNPDIRSTELPAGGEATTDPSVGTELVSGPRPGRRGGISIDTAIDWYQDMLALGERHDYAHEPTGIIGNTDYTAGLHIHISEWDSDKAERLYEVSTQEWMHVFACSSITETTGRANVGVFRGNRYCKQTFDRERYSVVHSVDPTEGHYEWRLPEPMDAEHFELLMEFLEKFHATPNDAVEWAQDLVMNADDRLTSIKRASELSDSIFDPPSVENTRVFRHPHPDTHRFYQQVRDDSSMPYIYRVDVDGEPYYAFHSHSDVEGDSPIGELFASPTPDEFSVDDFGTFPTDGIVHAIDLEPTDSNGVRQTIQDAMEASLTASESFEITEREPTDLLREVHPDLPAPTEA